MAARDADIFSVFGYAEAAAAAVMIREGKAEQITIDDIKRCKAPLTNDAGRPALFAVRMDRKHSAAFNALAADFAF